jgi:hypothetical protein
LQDKDANCFAFGKVEKQLKADPTIRMIHTRHPRYHAEVGCYLKRAEGSVYKALARLWRQDKVVFKGMNAKDQARHMRKLWLATHNPVAVGLDASRFDQHVSKLALEWLEHPRYLKMFGPSHRQWLKELLDKQLVNKCTAHTQEGIFKYKVEGCRMSGDMNTSLGNCLIMCCLLHAYAAERGVTCRLANNGDDCVVIMSKGDLARFSAGLHGWFETMGFDMKVEDAVYDFEQIEFCQTHPVFLADGWRMVRNFPNCLVKDSISTVPHNEKGMRKWMAGVGEAGLALACGVPCLQAFYTALRRQGTPGKERVQGGLAWLSKGLRNRELPITEEARFSFYLAFGVSPDAQKCYENMAAQWEYDHTNRPFDVGQFPLEFIEPDKL